MYSCMRTKQVMEMDLQLCCNWMKEIYFRFAKKKKMMTLLFALVEFVDLEELPFLGTVTHLNPYR